MIQFDGFVTERISGLLRLYTDGFDGFFFLYRKNILTVNGNIKHNNGVHYYFGIS
jgi:hypothetical protein